MPTLPESTGPSRLRLRLLLAGSVLLVLAGVVAFVYASRVARHKTTGPAAGQAVTVTIRDGACDPSHITVPAGRSTFTIVNQSARAVEWEILDGVLVLEERENIAPGISQNLTTKLSPGTFQITCGLLGNPRGTLVVTPSAESDREAAKPPVENFVGPLAEYRVYAVLESGSLLAKTKLLAEAVQAGDLARAREAYAPAHQAYEHIAAVASTFADLDTRINARAEYFEKRETDPAFAGFQRLAFALFRQGDVKGQSAVAMQLQADVTTLQERLRNLDLSPDQLASSAARQVQKLASSSPAADGFEDTASQLQGVQKVVDVLRPLLTRANPDLLKQLDASFAALPSKAGDKASDAASLTPKLQALAQQLAKINPALGLE